VTKQKFFSLLVIAGMLVAAFAPFLHKNQMNVKYNNVSNVVVSQATILLHSVYDDHSNDQSEISHCEACHVFSYLYSAPHQSTMARLIVINKYYGLVDVFSGRTAESFKRPPRLLV
jgi:hypothetical protein